MLSHTERSETAAVAESTPSLLFHTAATIIA
jgi:hypothetical protein